MARRRVIYSPGIGTLGKPGHEGRRELLGELGPDTVFMMGDNPALPKMPKAPALADFFRLRFHPRSVNHLLQSASMALEAGLQENLVLACLLHDIANAGLIGTD